MAREAVKEHNESDVGGAEDAASDGEESEARLLGQTAVPRALLLRGCNEGERAVSAS